MFLRAAARCLAPAMFRPPETYIYSFIPSRNVIFPNSTRSSVPVPRVFVLRRVCSRAMELPYFHSSCFAASSKGSCSVLCGEATLFGFVRPELDDGECLVLAML